MNISKAPEVKTQSSVEPIIRRRTLRNTAIFRTICAGTGGGALLASVLLSTAVAQTPELLLDRALKRSRHLQSQSVNSQQRVESLDDEARSLLQKYRTETSHLAQVQASYDQLLARTANQKAEIASVAQQLADLSGTEQKITPLLESMLNALEQFVALDAPFLAEERSLRLQSLRALLSDAAATDTEKYRRLLQAYQVEVKYGNTLEAYEARIPVGAVSMLVQILRFGRVGLYYVTLDEQQAGHWDRHERRWVKLQKQHIVEISRGLAIARGRLPAELLKLPVRRDPSKGSR